MFPAAVTLRDSRRRAAVTMCGAMIIFGAEAAYSNENLEGRLCEPASTISAVLPKCFEFGFLHHPLSSGRKNGGTTALDDDELVGIIY